MYHLVIMDDMPEAAQAAADAVAASPCGSLFSVSVVGSVAQLEQKLRGGGCSLRCADRRYSA